MGLDADDAFRAGATIHEFRKETFKPEPQPCVYMPDWISRELPALDYLLGELVHTRSRIMIAAATGLGKTMLGLGMALAIAAGIEFMHWGARRPGKVFYIDGEMSRIAMQQRIITASRRAGMVTTRNLMVFNREDFPGMEPLNKEGGHKWLNAMIDKYGKPDFCMFDNLQALCTGDMKEEDLWAGVIPMMHDFTKREIGQFWFHHTGHDASRSYGSKAKEWQLDTAGIMERADEDNDDLNFTLRFTKHRERTPDNAHNFDPVTMRLDSDDRWSFGATTAGAASKLRGAQKLAYEALVNMAAEHGTKLPAHWNFPQNCVGVAVEQLRKCLKDTGVIRQDATNPSARFNELVNGMKLKGKAAEKEGLIWPILK